MVWSTDYKRHGHVDLIPYLAPTHGWNMRWLGWIDWTPSGAINLAPTAVKPKPPVVGKPLPSASPWAHGDVYRNRLHYGQQKSDSVKRMQYVLNTKWGYHALAVTGSYDVYTDTVVRSWQKRIGGTMDPIRKSFIGPQEFVKLFPQHSYNLHV